MAFKHIRFCFRPKQNFYHVRQSITIFKNTTLILQFISSAFTEKLELAFYTHAILECVTECSRKAVYVSPLLRHAADSVRSMPIPCATAVGA